MIMKQKNKWTHPCYDIINAEYICQCNEFKTKILGDFNSHVFSNHNREFAKHAMSINDYNKYYKLETYNDFKINILKEIEFKKRYELARRKLIGDGCSYDKKQKAFIRNNNIIITKKDLSKKIKEMILVI